MADLLSILGVKIDPSGAKAGAADVNKALNSMRVRAKQVGASMRTSINSVGGLIAKMGALTGGLSVGFAVKSALTEFRDFEQGMKNVAAVSGATDAQLKQLSETALNLAKNTVFNPKQATEGLYSLASAGLNAEQQMAALPNVLNLAAAAQADLGQTTEVTVALMNNFGLSAGETERIVDVLTASIGASAQNMDRLMTSLRNGGPTAAAFGQDMEQSIAAINILTTSFGNGELAGTGFAAVLRLMAEKGHEFGIEVKDSAGNLRPLIDIIRDMEEAGITGAQALDVFGARGGPALALLLNQGSEAIQEMTDKIQANGQAADVASQQMDTLGGDLAGMFSSLDVLQVKIGESGSGFLRDFVQKITVGIDTITDNLPLINAEIAIMGQEWSKVGNLIKSGLDIMWTGLKNLFDLEDDGDGFFKFLLRSLQEFPVNAAASFDIVKAHFFALVDSLPFKWESFKTSTQSVFNVIGGAWDTLWDNASVKWGEFRDWMLNSLADVIDKIVEAFAKIPLDTFQGWANDLAGVSDNLRLSADNAERSTRALEANRKSQVVRNRVEQTWADLLEFEEQQIIKNRDAQIDAAFETREAALEAQEAQREAARAAGEHDDVLEEVKLSASAVRKEYEGMAKTSEVVIKEIWDNWDEFIGYQIGSTQSATDEIKSFWEDMRRTLVAGDIGPSIATAIEIGVKEGFEKGFEFIKKVIKDNPLEFANSAIQFGNFAADRFKENDSAVRAVAEIASAIPGPVGQIAQAIIGLDDLLFGGKLLGTNYEQTGGGFSAGVGRGGTSGEQFIIEEREKALFGGTKTKITTSELDASIQTALDDIFEAIKDTLLVSARALRTEIPDLIGGEFEQEFDKDGNIVKSVSKVLGRTFEESFEDFGKRLTAENILAVLAQKFTDEVAIPTAGIPDGRVVPISGEFEPPPTAGTTQYMNEIHAIAERWRDDAETLLDGAQFLLLAAADIEEGFQLLGEGGTLTQITDLIENMQLSGESLVETYTRVAGSTKLLEDAFGLIGISLDLTREEFVRFAADISEAAGGLDNASRLWNSYFQNYFSENERTVFALEQINDEVGRLTEKLGIDSIDFDSFRTQFETALPNLTPAEIVDWLKLGDALSRANDLAGLTSSSIVEAASNLYDVTADFEASQATIGEQLSRNTTEINNLLNGWDGSVDSQERLLSLVQNRYELELAMLAQVKATIEGINATITSAQEQIRLSTLDDEGKYNFFKERAEEGLAEIPFMTDVAQIGQAVDDVTADVLAAWNLLGPEAQAANQQWFLDFLEGLNAQANAKIGELTTGELETGESLADKIAAVMDARVEREEAAAEKMEAASETMLTAARDMTSAAAAIPSTISANVTVQVDYPDQPSYQVGGIG